MASKNGFDRLTTRDQNFIAFCDELRAYVEEHHLFPDKHTRLSHKIKYTRKKINEGTQEEWKRVMFEEIAGMRDLSYQKVLITCLFIREGVSVNPTMQKTSS